METRPFSRTGETFPILSFGGQRIVDEHNCTEEGAIGIFQRYHPVGATGEDSLEDGRLGQSHPMGPTRTRVASIGP